MPMHIQIAYTQGAIKSFVTTSETRLKDFVEVAKSFGRFRSVRFQRDLTDEAAQELVANGQAIKVEVQRG